jgi:DNA primase
MSLSPQWLDELRSRITLSALIGKTVKVTRAGREHKACCPFHNEKTPSFTINDEKGFYHCFGCGAHGDAIRWMTDNRGLSFMDAVKDLAASAGMEVPKSDPKAAAQAEKALGLRDACEAAATWYAGLLESDAGASTRAYLTQRGISAGTARAFGMGLAPDRRDAIGTALEKFGPEMLIEAGLLIKVDNKAPYDRFRGRLMIPIRDARGRTIAFGGRILGDGEPKYLNSPDTPLFDKGRTLYNLDRAAPAARAAGQIIVVEGYMDVIALAQAGIAEAVAPLGTALTEQQIQMLWRHNDTPILCFDGDAAGQKAAMRAATRALPLLRPGFSLKFATLPAGQDPDDVVRSGGAKAFDAILEAAEPLVDRLWSAALSAGPMQTPEERAMLKKRLKDYSDAIGDNDIASHYRQIFRERHDALFFTASAGKQSGVPQAGGRPGARRWAPDPRQLPPSNSAQALGKKGLSNPLAQAIMAGMLRYPQRILPHAEHLATILSDDANIRDLAEIAIGAACQNPALDSAALQTILSQSGVGAGTQKMVQSLMRANAISFSFTRSIAADADDDANDRAVRDLDEAIEAALAWKAINSEFAAVTARAAVNFDDHIASEQQALALAKREWADRIEKLRSRGN